MVKQSAGKAAAGGGGGSLKTVVLVAIAVVALGVAGTLVFHRATQEDVVTIKTVTVTCKTCGTKYEVPYQLFSEAFEKEEQMVADCPECGNPQPCYAGDDPDAVPGRKLPMHLPYD